MKRFVLAVALTGLMSVTVLAGDIPINGVVAPQPAPTSSTSTSTSALLTNVVLTIITLISR